MGSSPAERTIRYSEAIMTSEDDLEAQVLLLASHDWRARRAASNALTAAGSSGLAAVLRGLDHADPPVRRGCFDFLDHHANELCIDDLRRLALTDPVPQVRRFAVHALSCVRCKTRPLEGDVVEFLSSVIASSGETVKVRREAIYALSHYPRDARAVPALKLVLDQESDRDLRKAAHRVLRLHDPACRSLTDEQARQASLAGTRTR